MLFGEVPNSVTMLGAGIIIASTLYIGPARSAARSAQA